MRKLISLLAVALMTLSFTGCQLRTPAVAPDPARDEAAEQFIRGMYNTINFQDYDYLRSHCTENLLEKLAEAYEYDGEGLAVWLFRSGAQDSKYEFAPTKILRVTPIGDNWYAYTALDAGWKFTNALKLLPKGDSFQMDDVVMVCDEVGEDNGIE